MNQIIKQTYENNYFPGFEKLFKLTKVIEPSVKRADIQTFLKSQESAQQTKQRNESKNQGHIIALNKNDVWQMDIFVMDRYGNNITLDDGKVYKRENLLKVDESSTNNSTIIEKAKKDKVVRLALKRDDIDSSNILSKSRR
jgi:hypothetical protein